MNCFLYQLRFNTPVHFGGSDSALSLYSSEDHFRADTLFSALCHTALQLQGSQGLDKVLKLGGEGKLLLSDAMPWREDSFYLPKPFYAAQTARELPADKRKAIKKLAWIPVSRFEEYCRAMGSGVLFECDAPSFGTAYETTRAMVPEVGDTRPYPVGLYQFRENCGLYFLAALDSPEEEAWLSQLVCALGLSGIGGKTSSGCGKFTVAQRFDLRAAVDGQLKWLRYALESISGHSMLLTTSLPREEELETVLNGASYQLVRRAGFVASDSYADSPRKKQTQYFLSAGSILKQRFSGDLYQIGSSGAHLVLRYSRPMFLGVTL